MGPNASNQVIRTLLVPTAAPALRSVPRGVGVGTVSLVETPASSGPAGRTVP